MTATGVVIMVGILGFFIPFDLYGLWLYSFSGKKIDYNPEIPNTVKVMGHKVLSPQNKRHNGYDYVTYEYTYNGKTFHVVYTSPNSLNRNTNEYHDHVPGTIYIYNIYELEDEQEFVVWKSSGKYVDVGTEQRKIRSKEMKYGKIYGILISIAAMIVTVLIQHLLK